MTFLAVILAVSLVGFAGGLAVLRRGSGPVGLAAKATVPARASRARRRAAR